MHFKIASLSFDPDEEEEVEEEEVEEEEEIPKEEVEVTGKKKRLGMEKYM